ncbi:MAG: beta-galactosidase, partial [Anaerolineae bacterium]|nr:beta-galactosidase [Anaerolineae bacterium]
MRRYLVFVLFLFTLTGSLSALAATQHAMQFQLRGYVDATQTANLPYRIPRLGVNADLFQYSTGELIQNLEWMQQAHIHWIRQFAYWDQLEPQPGDYAWDAWDDLLETLQD